LTEAFFEQEAEDRFVPTGHTQGPWEPGFQHGGPPAALLGRTIGSIDDRDDMQVARITFEILAPVPIEPLDVAARVVRPGRRVQLVQASLSTEKQEVMRATAWRIRTTELDLPEGAAAPPPDTPEDGVPPDALFEVGADQSYLHAMEWRFVVGGFVRPGPAVAWVRMRHPLIAGEPISPLTRAVIAVDSGSGISANLDLAEWLFINPDLTVYLHRLPAGDWIRMASSSVYQPNGIGLADTLISDPGGDIGRSLQSLLVAPRR